MYTVLVTAPTFAPCGVKLLEDGNCKVLYAKTEQEIIRILAGEKVDAIISRTLRLTQAAIEACPSLRVISKHGAGYDNVDVSAATRLNIPVFYTPGANAQSVAELVFGLMIAVARSVIVHDQTLRKGAWDRAGAGQQLSGRTLGVVGLGNVGRKVAGIGAAFGMRVIGYDPYIQNAPCETVFNLEALLPQAQILTLHCPLTSETRGMIGVKELAALPKNAIVVNTARGGIVDETALAAAIEAGKVLGAGFDVFAEEPMTAGHPFHMLAQTVMTPHIGGSTRESLDAVAMHSVKNVLDFLYKRPFDRSHCVNPSTLSAER